MRRGDNVIHGGPAKENPQRFPRGKAASLGSKLNSAWGKQNWAQGPGVAKDLVACLLAATLVGCCEGIILASISFNLSRGFGPSLR